MANAKMPDIFPPKDRSALDGLDLIQHYSKIDLLQLTPADFKLAYDLLSDCKACSISWDTNLVKLNAKTAKRYKTTAKRIDSVFPSMWLHFSDSSNCWVLMVPKEYLSSNFVGTFYSSQRLPGEAF